MTTEQAFKIGFLKKAEQTGLSPEQKSAFVKKANDFLNNLLESAKGVVGSAQSGDPRASALLGSLLGGTLGGGMTAINNIGEGEDSSILASALKGALLGGAGGAALPSIGNYLEQFKAKAPAPASSAAAPEPGNSPFGLGMNVTMNQGLYDKLSRPDRSSGISHLPGLGGFISGAANPHHGRGALSSAVLEGGGSLAGGVAGGGVGSIVSSGLGIKNPVLRALGSGAGALMGSGVGAQVTRSTAERPAYLNALDPIFGE